jgi:tRNA threonylcarbamoyladenosine biosynthesis protein TsaE
MTVINMEPVKIKIECEKDTIRLGEKLAAILEAGDVVGLRGDLGAGKTFLSGIVARSLGVPLSQPVNSPTFTLINEYTGGRLPVYHMDLYRLGDPDELYELGIWEYYDGDGVCLVEWFDKFDDLWPDDALLLTIELGEGGNRSVTVSGEKRGGELALLLGETF